MLHAPTARAHVHAPPCSPPSSPEADRLGFCQRMAEEYPKSNAVKRMAILLASGEGLRALLEPYLQSGLRKGKPSVPG